MGVRVLPVYGGEPIGRQLRALKRGVDVVVATPGRALDHINRGTLKLSGLEIVVLDEADEMLDMGFAEDIEAILASTPGSGRPRCSRRRCRRGSTAWCAATCATRCGSNSAAGRRRQPTDCWCGKLPTSCRAGTRPPLSVACSTWRRPTATIVFCRTRDEVDQLTESLNGRGYRAEALHGGMDQKQRDRVMARLRSQAIDLLVATDVAARGLDIDQLTHVVNYDVPSAPESYVHRIGRVGRAGREGTAITLAEPREHRMLKTIERATKRPIAIEKLPTVAKLRAMRLELMRTELRESLLKDDGDLNAFRAVVGPLGAEFGLFEVALAAVKLAHEASGTPRERRRDPCGRNAVGGRPPRRPEAQSR
jgi:ATP-dependent RNA helicase DeaD